MRRMFDEHDVFAVNDHGDTLLVGFEDYPLSFFVLFMNSKSQDWFPGSSSRSSLEIIQLF